MRRAHWRDTDPEVSLRSATRDLGPLFDSVAYAKGSDTSQDAADELSGERVARLRAAVLQAYVEAGERGLTADECCERIGETPFGVRPRVTEWFKSGHLERTQERRRNSSGMMARVLRRVV